LVTVTGLVLSLEPMYIATGDVQQRNLETHSIADLLAEVQYGEEEFLEISIDNNGFIRAFTFDTEDGSYYISKQGTKIQTDYVRSPIFEVTTNFHRSLFLKSTGRIMIGIVSFLLVLIAISGLVLALKKLGFTKFLLPFEKVGRHPYYHTYFGRIFIVPILVIAITGVVLSMVRFDMIDTGLEPIEITRSNESVVQKQWTDFDVFKETPLSEVEKIEFPFSTSEEDYFVITLKDKRLSVHQVTGEVIEAQVFSEGKWWADGSFHLHTGASLPYWSIVLFLASVCILYFMYSGFLISYRRLKGRTTNKFLAAEAELVLLIGSENGKTQQFGKLLYNAILEKGMKVYIDELNNYREFPKMRELVVLTSTYGDGEPPANAHRFLDLIHTHTLSHEVRYSVVGFGSKKYPKFCQFAKDVHKAFLISPLFIEGVKPKFIDKSDFLDFKKWVVEWGALNDVTLSLPDQIRLDKNEKYRFKVVHQTLVDDQYSTTAFLELSCSKMTKLLPGDLLAIQNEGMKEERLYSVGKSHNGNILLAVKRHPFGMASTFLSNLKPDNVFFATHQLNPHFRIPYDAQKVVMIANGTGVAPFIGMIHDKKFRGERDLYWGIRTKEFMNPLRGELDVAIQNGTLSRCSIACSKDAAAYNYVQESLLGFSEQVAKDLIEGAVFMLCGSLAMQKSVEDALCQIIALYGLRSLEEFKANQQILADCY